MTSPTRPPEFSKDKGVSSSFTINSVTSRPGLVLTPKKAGLLVNDLLIIVKSEHVA